MENFLTYCSLVQYIFISPEQFHRVVQYAHSRSSNPCWLGREFTMYVHVVAAPDLSPPYACLLFLVPVGAWDDTLCGRRTAATLEHAVCQTLTALYDEVAGAGRGPMRRIIL
jgi:hypothetical protein